MRAYWAEVAQNAVMGVLVGCLIVVVIEIQRIKRDYVHRSELPQAVADIVEPKAKIHEMLSARMDCERVIKRTQECILYFEYIPVEKPR